MAKKAGGKKNKGAKSAKASAKKGGRRGVVGMTGEGMSMPAGARSRRGQRRGGKRGKQAENQKLEMQRQQRIEREMERKAEKEEKKKKKKEEEDDDGPSNPTGLPAEEKMEILVWMWKKLFWS